MRRMHDTGSPSHHSAGQRVRPTVSGSSATSCPACRVRLPLRAATEAHWNLLSSTKQPGLLGARCDIVGSRWQCSQKSGDSGDAAGVFWDGPPGPALSARLGRPRPRERLPVQLGLASYSIPPTQVAVKAQCDKMMASVPRSRPLSAATDLTDYTDRTDTTIEADVCRRLIRFPAYPTTRAQLMESFP